MTNQESIKQIKEIAYYLARIGARTKEMAEAHNLAISALEKQINGGWIKCSDRLPEYTDDYNVTVGIGCMMGYYEEVRTYRYEIFNGKNPYKKWIIPDRFDEVVNIIAWQPLPEPYKESEEE